MRFQFALLFLFTLFQAAAQEQPAAQHVTFIQLTDAHVFDDGWKAPGSEPYWQALDDRTALHWAVDRINEIASSSGVDFVVYTGDFGLQNVFFSDSECNRIKFKSEPGLPPFNSGMAVQEFAMELDRLRVQNVYVVPGNNDLIDEQAIDYPRFECFVSMLQDKLQTLPGRIQLWALRADAAVNVKGIRLAGLNTASFKSEKNYAGLCGSSPPPRAAFSSMACPSQQFRSLEGLLHRNGSPLLIFTHVPDLIDPYRKDRSWDIDDNTRQEWVKLAVEPKLVGILAGHFHSNQRDLYGTNSGTRGLFVDPLVGEKTWVAPPLAGKNQRDGKVQARGIMLVNVEINQGKLAMQVSPVWYPGPSEKKGAFIMSPLLFFGLVVVVILITGLFGGYLNYLLNRKDNPDDPGLGANLILGIGAAFLVPLFLHVIGSDLVGTMHGSAGTGPDYSKVLVFAGFCLVASMSAKAFIKSVSNLALRRAENAEKLAGEAKKEASQAQALMEHFVEPPEATVQSASAFVSSTQPSKPECEVLRALANQKYVLRTSAGIAVETRIEKATTDQILNSLYERKLIEKTGFAGADKKDRTYWYITAEGNVVLAKCRTESDPT